MAIRSIPICEEIVQKRGRAFRRKNDTRRETTIAGVGLAFEWNMKPLERIAKEFILKSKSSKEQNDLFRSDFDSSESQPEWDISDTEWTPNRNNEFNDPDYDRHSNQIIKNLPITRFSAYISAHQNMERYGIYLNPICISKLANDINELMDGRLSNLDSFIVSIEYSFWRAMAHAWVEDLCSICETISGIDYYSQTQAQYNSYIYMQEAIANSASTGMLKMFFQSHTLKDEILSAINELLSNQPRGFSSFVELKWWCTHNEIFQRNMHRLLVDVYKIPSEIVIHSLRLFFEPTAVTFELFSSGKRMRTMNYERINVATSMYIDRYDYPVYVDLVDSL